MSARAVHAIVVYQVEAARATVRLRHARMCRCRLFCAVLSSLNYTSTVATGTVQPYILVVLMFMHTDVLKLKRKTKKLTRDVCVIAAASELGELLF